MTNKFSKSLCVFLLCSIVFCDQATKFIAHCFLQNDSLIVCPFLSFCYSRNTGAAWNLFSGNAIILAGLGIITAIILIASRKHLETFSQQIAVTLILGGILGNTIDRIFRGYVIDFISIDLNFYRWPTFNVADSALCIGAVILLFTFQKKA